MARRWKIKFSEIFGWICIAERGAPFSISAAELRDLMGGDMQDERTEKSSLSALVLGAQKQHKFDQKQHQSSFCHYSSYSSTSREGMIKSLTDPLEIQ